MNSYEPRPFGPSPAHLELSQEELADVYWALAKAAIDRVTKYLEPTENTDGYPVDDTSSIPQLFALPLPARKIREIFYTDDECTVKRGELSYLTPYKISAEDEDSRSSVEVFMQTTLDGGIVRDQRYVILLVDDEYEAYEDIEYSKGGHKISPNDVTFDSASSVKDFFNTAAQDSRALENPLTLDVAEKLRELVRYVNEADQL